MKIDLDSTTRCCSMVPENGGRSRSDNSQTPVLGTETPTDSVVVNVKDNQHKTIIIEIVVCAIILGIAYMSVKGFI